MQPGQKIREILFEERITQVGLARRMDVTAGMVNHILKGRTRVSKGVAVKLAKALPEYDASFFAALQAMADVMDTKDIGD